MSKSMLQQILIPIVILILFVIGIYGIVRLKNNPAIIPPTIDVNVEDNLTTTKDKIDISGTTSAKELTINDKKVNIGDDGGFSDNLLLKVGVNKVVFKARTNNQTETVEQTIVRKNVAQKTNSAVVARRTAQLSTSGPAENIGIVGLSALILAAFYCYKTRVRKNFKYRYKLFTNSRF